MLCAQHIQFNLQFRNIVSDIALDRIDELLIGVCQFASSILLFDSRDDLTNDLQVFCDKLRPLGFDIVLFILTGQILA
ncbi:hypothetical protein L0Z66_15845 [Phaeobacter sp. BS34]